MELFWKAVAALLLASVLGLTIARQERDLSAMVVMAGCCLGAVAAMKLLEPVLDMLRQLESIANLSDGMLSILLKCTGMSLIAEIAGMICLDSSSASLGKTLQILGTAAVLYMSTPLFTNVLSLIREILYRL